MATIEKNPSEIIAYFFAIVILSIVIAVYGKQAIEWISSKLYEFFIQRS